MNKTKTGRYERCDSRHPECYLRCVKADGHDGQHQTAKRGIRYAWIGRLKAVQGEKNDH